MVTLAEGVSDGVAERDRLVGVGLFRGSGAESVGVTVIVEVEVMPGHAVLVAVDRDTVLPGGEHVHEVGAVPWGEERLQWSPAVVRRWLLRAVCAHGGSLVVKIRFLKADS